MRNKFILFLLLFISSSLLFAQTTVEVSGIVTSQEEGEPLIGVSVHSKGGNAGTATDINGRYSLSVPVNSTLTFSYVGYNPKEVVVRKGGQLDVVLSSSENVLQEVVAIGYGTMKKSDLTGAVGSVSGKDLRAAPVAKVDQALQGRMAGVTVNSNSGQPGEGAIIRIRGIGTVGESSPIYVIDGIITDNINFLSPSDIASLEVLKDASAAAIYGSRGANGVILITTKQGDGTGKQNITFESYFGVQNRWKKLDVMGRDEMARSRAIFSAPSTLEELERDGFNKWLSNNATAMSMYDKLYPRIMSEEYPDGFDYSSVDTDWQDAIFVKDATIQNYYLSADGGNEKSSYLISGNYFDQEGLLIGSYYTRLTLRVNTSFQVKKWLKIGENLSFSNSKSRNIQNNGNTALIASALSMAPWDPVKYPEGTYSNWARKGETRADAVDLSGKYSSPSLFRNVAHPYNQALNAYHFPNNDDWVGNLWAEITPVKGLVVRGDVATKLWYGMNRTYTPILTDVTFNAITRNGVSAWMERSKYMAYTGTATYNTLINKKHDLMVMFGVTADEFDRYRISASGSDLAKFKEKDWYITRTPDTVELTYDATGKLTNARPTRTGSDDPSGKIRMASYIGRVHYVFDNKYLLTSNIRYDGSAKLTKGLYWHVFPSIAAAWKINEEEFFEPLEDKVDFLKLRLGWGRLGNERSLSANGSIASITSSGSWMYAYPLGSPNVLQAGKGMLYYPSITRWESTEQYNVGLDFSLFHGLLSGNLDLFKRYTYDMLMDMNAPAHVGNRYAPKGNAGTVLNQGVELLLEHRNRIGDFSYNVGGNLSFLKNKLTKLNDGEPLWDGVIVSNEGYSLNTIYALKYDGVFQTQEEINNYTWTNPETGEVKMIQPDAQPGDAKYLDLPYTVKEGSKYVDYPADGKIDELDRTDCGNPFPWLTYGLNLGVEYKGFDMQMFFQGVAGNKVYNYLRQNKLEGDSFSSVLSTDMKNVFLPGPDPDDPTKTINIMPGSNGSIPNPTITSSPDNKKESSRFVEDASYLRLKNFQLGYTIPKHLTKNIIGIERARIYVAASNLLTFTKYKGYDPEVGNNGRDYGNYPQVRTVMVGVNVNL